MSESKEQEALRIFLDLAKKADCATDLHNAFFGNGAIFGKLFPTRAEREAFATTPEYQEMVRIRVEMKKREKSASY